MSEDQEKRCCEMREKVALGIAKIYTEDECGVKDSAMVDYHNFGYASPRAFKVAIALSFKFCPWCGETRAGDTNRRTVEVLRAKNE